MACFYDIYKHSHWPLSLLEVSWLSFEDSHVSNSHREELEVLYCKRGASAFAEIEEYNPSFFMWDSTPWPALGSDLCFLKTQISRHRNGEKGKSTSSTDSRKTGALASLYLLKGHYEVGFKRAFFFFLFSSETHRGGALLVTRRGNMVFSSTSKKRTKAIHRLIQIHWLMRWWCISLSHYKQAERLYWIQQHANGTKGN